MADTLLNDPIALRHCILYEFLGGAPIWEAYKTLCNRIGQIDYPEFEFWYVRFANKQYDVHYDRSQDQKPREFLSLPMEMLEMVLEKLPLMSRLVVRKVSKKLKSCEDQMHLQLRGVTFTSYRNLSQVYFINDEDNKQCVEYQGSKNCVVKHNLCEKIVPDASNFELALNDLMVCLKNPNLSMKRLEISTDIIRKVNKSLRDLSHKVKVETAVIKIYNYNGKMPFLPYLDPKTLKKINITIRQCQKINDLIEIRNLEQYQSAEEVHVHIRNSKYFNIKHFVGCRRLYLKFNWEDGEKAVIDIIKDVLNSNVMENVHISQDYGGFYSVHIIFKESLAKMYNAAETKEGSMVYHVPTIGGYFELNLESYRIVTVEKKKVIT